MAKNHIKRLATPKSWPIARKDNVFVAKSDPGAHPMNMSLPLVVVLRDVLGIAENARETKSLINRELVYVNGKKVKSYRLPVGLFDCISFPTIDKYYRIVLNKKGKIDVIEIDKSESDKFILQVIGKRLLKDKRVQLNLSSGMNIILPYEEHSKYSLYQSVLVSYPPLKIIESLPLKKKAKVFMLSGKHLGRIAEVQDMKEDGKEAVLEEGGVVFNARVGSFVVVGEKETAVRIV